MPAVTIAQFADPAYKLTGDLLEVPHIGPKGKAALEKSGVTTTWQLIALYLENERDEDKFVEALRQLNMPTEFKHHKEVAHVFSGRVCTFGIKLDIPMSDWVTESSMLTATERHVFLIKPYDQDMAKYFKGIAKETVKDLKKRGTYDHKDAPKITSTDLLFAFMLRATPITKSATTDVWKEFYDKLKKIIPAKGWTATIIDQMSSRLQVGLLYEAPKLKRIDGKGLLGGTPEHSSKRKFELEPPETQVAAEKKRRVDEMKAVFGELKAKKAKKDAVKRVLDTFLKNLKKGANKKKAEDAAKKIMESDEPEHKEVVQRVIRKLGKCVVGFDWVKQSDGSFCCLGGSHRLSENEVTKLLTEEGATHHYVQEVYCEVVEETKA